MEFKIICPDCGNSDFDVDAEGLVCNNCREFIETVEFEVEAVE